MRRVGTITVFMLALASAAWARPWTEAERRAGHFCGTTRGPAGAEVARHLYHLKQLERQGMPATFASPGNRDIGNISVIEATRESGILIEANPFDLKQRSLRFKRNADGTYTAQFSGAKFDGAAGTKLDLTDDDSELIQLGFSFKFFDRTYTSAYLNTDGNFTMEKGDNESSDRNFTRFNSMPRIAPLFDDLNPQQGGEVTMAKLADRVVITWNNVPEYDSSSVLPPNRFQVVLYKTGDIQFNWTSTMSPTLGIVGITPGLSGNDIPQIADYSVDAPIASIPGAIGEIFANERDIDYFSIVRSFIAAHTDSYDTVLIWTASRDVQIISAGSGAFAFEQALNNQTRGIGRDIFDYSSFVGSQGRFRSIVVMDYLGKYPSNPYQLVPRAGENNTVSLLGQEVGHIWLAFPQIMENGVRTENLLGRDSSHWSFNYDSDASVMEGNDIQDNGNGTFTTIATVDRYSALDQYLIGLRTSSSVPDGFYVANAGVDPGTGPRTGVTIFGNRVNVNVGQVVQAEGVRDPSWDKAQHVFNEGWVLLVPDGASASGTDLSKLEGFRTAWADFFNDAVEDRGLTYNALTGGALQGKTTDKKGTPLAGIQITVKHKKYGIVQTVTSGADGSYVLSVLPAADYQLIGKRGSKQVKKSAKIVSSETVTVDFKF